MTGRHPTILDVAAKAGVSKSLVSLVMRGSSRVSEASRRKVLAAAEEIGYRPNVAARMLVRNRSQLIGLMISDLHNPFFTETLDGVEDAARDHGYRTIMTTGNLVTEREVDAVDTLLDLRVDGLILASPRFSKTQLERAAETVPTVVFGQPSQTSSADAVHNDDRVGSAAIVNHLVELGHRDIAHIAAPGSGGGNARKSGYRKAMQSHGLTDHIRIEDASFTEEGGAAAMRTLVEAGDLPTAVFVANDFAALGALEVLDDAGIDVPGDISIVGYDNLELAHNHRISLTTVDQPRYEMGRTSVELLVERLEDARKDARNIVLPPKLVLRDTTAPPRRGR